MLKSLKNHGLTVLFLVLLFGLVYFLVHKYRVPGSMTVLESQAMDMRLAIPLGTAPVSTEKVRESSFQPAIVCTGSVEAFGDEDLAARVTGRVTRVLVYPGDHVAAGQLVAQLDSAELTSKRREAQAARLERGLQSQMVEAALEKNQLEVTVAGKELNVGQSALQEARIEAANSDKEWRVQQAESERTYWLYQEGGVSLEERQLSDVKLQRAKAEWHHRLIRQRSAELQVEEMRIKLAAQGVDRKKTGLELGASRAGQQRAEAEAETAGITQGYTDIRTQEPGEVTQRLVSPGTLVMPGTVILKLRTQNRLRLQARVPARYLGQVRPGSLMVAKVQDSSQPFRVRISSVFRDVDMASQTFTVEALVGSRNSPHRLIPGQFVELTVPLAAARRQISVPLAALRKDREGRDFVWQITAGKSAALAHKALIVVSGIQGERVGIRSGLATGDEVIVDGADILQEGSQVGRVAWGPEGPADLPPPTHPAGTSMPGMNMGPEPAVAPDKVAPQPKGGSMPGMPGMDGK